MLLEIFINAATFRNVRLRHGGGDGVSIDNVQKEIGWVVVGFAEIASNTVHNNSCLVYI